MKHHKGQVAIPRTTLKYKTRLWEGRDRMIPGVCWPDNPDKS